MATTTATQSLEDYGTSKTTVANNLAPQHDHVQRVLGLAKKIQTVPNPGWPAPRGVPYIDKPYRLSIYRHFLKISISISISIRSLLKISISIRTFLKISISISIRTFLKISISISISIRTSD